MATYPGALPDIPLTGWTHDQVSQELEAVAAELGVNPSGTQADVAARFTAVEGRVTTLEGAASVAGVEVASAQLTTDYNILTQSPNNITFADIGLSIAVPAQTRAYNVTLSCTFVAVTSASFVPTKALYPAVRIVDSAVTAVLEASQFPMVMPSASVTYLAKGWLSARVPAGRAATTWKVQVRNGVAAPDAQVTTYAIYASTALGAPAGGVTRAPAQLQAITV